MLLSIQIWRIYKRHISTPLIELPLLLRSMNGREYVLKAQVDVIDADDAFLCGKKRLEKYGSKSETRKSILETCARKTK